MKTDRPIIVSLAENIRLQHRAKIWWSGWVAALILVGVVGYLSGRVTMALEAQRELEFLISEVAKVQAEQMVVNESYVKAWKNQQDTSKLLISWAQYIKERDEIITENKSGQKMAGKGM